jgi:hypothetical protein
MRRASIRLILVFPILFAACVPHTDIQGAPCDCPQGYYCCETLLYCLKNGSECPSTYPESSGNACTATSQCHWTEACWIWKENGSLQGPSDCRHRCPGEYPCPTGEVCEEVPTNASSLDDPELVRICIPE